jgi:hypothetical protein
MARFSTRPNPRTKPAKQIKSNTKKSPQTASRSSGRTTQHDRVLGLLQAKGGYDHCGDFEGHRMAAALGTGFLRRGREEEAWTDAGF